MFERWSLRLRVFLLFGLLAGLALLGVVAGALLGYQRLAAPEASDGFVIAVAVACLAILGATAWIWLLFDENVAKPSVQLAADLRARAQAGLDAPIATEAARYLGDLGPAAHSVARNLAEQRQESDALVARATARIAGENERLGLLLRDAPVGVILCGDDHRVVLYNRRAEDVLSDDAAAPLGLDRSLFDFLASAPIRAALARLPEGERGAIELICATVDRKRTLLARMKRVDHLASDPARSGYVLTLADVTERFAAGAASDRALRDALAQAQARIANLEKQAATLKDGAVRADVAALSTAIDELRARCAQSAAARWPMAPVAAEDLIAALKRRLQRKNIPLVSTAPAIAIACDALALTTLLERVVLLAAERGGRDFALDVEAKSEGVLFVFHFRGPAPDDAALEAHLAQPIDVDHPERRLGDVLLALGGALRAGAPDDAAPAASATAANASRLLLTLRARVSAAPARERPPRPEFYDFALMERAPAAAMDARALDELTFVVFDSETTGLAPERGDEMVQLAACRVVNGRILTGEIFETLVDPGRPIPAVSTKIHQITDRMVEGAPAPAAVVRSFHAFAENAVLVAHNARFDMAFLRRREAELGLAFTQPVLDTVLLSALAYGRHDDHSLDALAARLGVDFAPGSRHTAMGDAKVTADVLIKLLAMLKSEDLATLGQLSRAASTLEKMLD